MAQTSAPDTEDVPAPEGVHFYSRLKQVPIKVGMLENGQKVPFGPWGAVDATFAALVGGLAIWIAWTNKTSGWLWLIVLIGVIVTAGGVTMVRQLLPHGRPGLATRGMWLVQSYFPAQLESPDAGELDG